MHLLATLSRLRVKNGSLRWVDRKIEALLAHRSQWRSTMGIDDDPDDQRAAFADKLFTETRAAALRAGLRAAEAFARIDAL